MPQTVKMTITEGLAAVKTINKRLNKKRMNLMPYLWRHSSERDLLEKSGGSAEHIKREMQGISDIESRLIGIRDAILAANRTYQITVRGITRTISEWLTWRREVAKDRLLFLSQMHQGILAAREKARQKSMQVTTSSQTEDMNALVIVIDEAALVKDIELMEQVLGDLDGQLQLKNATLTIDVPADPEEASTPAA